MVGLFIFLFLFAIAFIIFMIVATWKVFEKAGQPGWACIIPIYNMVVMLRIVGKPWWWILLMIVPFIIGTILTITFNGDVMMGLVAFCIDIVGYVFIIWQYNMLSKSFGKNEGFTVGLIFLSFIFFPILGFGDAQYLGPYGNKAAFDAYGQKNRFDFEDNKLEN